MAEEYPFDSYGGNPPHNEQDTSKEAAGAIRKHVTAIATNVLSLFSLHGGMTCDEVEIHSGLSHQTASARIRELVLAHYLEDSTLRRRVRSGRNAIVWRIRDPQKPVTPVTV